MLDSETVIRYPHDATVTPRGGKKHVQVNDPRTSVTMTDQGCELVLFFEGADFSGGAQLLEVRMLPAAGAPFEPWQFVPRLPLYLKYARATMTFEHGDATRALRALRQLGSTRRGLSDDFYRLIAQSYQALIAEGEKYPVKALKTMQHVDMSTASRWITEAKRRGLIPPE